jgi:hypothetical protein
MKLGGGRRIKLKERARGEDEKISGKEENKMRRRGRRVV